MIKKYKSVFAVVCILALCTSGCGKQGSKEQELEAFSSSMVDFANKIQAANDEINEIDIESNHSTEDLLRILDDLEQTFFELSEAPIPSHYQGIEDLADEAYSNMSNAVSFYHAAYEAQPFGTDDAQIAYQYYTRAMTRVEYIGYILTGNIPENNNVTVYNKSDESQLINKILQTDSE